LAEIIMRVETSEGFKSYAVDEDMLQVRAVDTYKTVMEVLPDIIRVPESGLMFALRHGPIQKLLRNAGLEPMCKDCPDKDSTAVGALVRLFIASAHRAEADAGTTTLDMMQSDLRTDMAGFIRRVPEYDDLPSVFPRSTEAQIEAPGPHPAPTTLERIATGAKVSNAHKDSAVGLETR
jgi:hypothetical protein